MVAVAFMASATISSYGEVVEISTPNTSLILNAEKGKKLRHVYYGARISDKDSYNQLASAVGEQHDAYPAYGLTNDCETAVAATHGDGNMTLDLIVEGVERGQIDDAEVTTIKLRDSYYPFYVDLKYRTRPGLDIVETWTEISHREKGDVVLTQYDSGYLPVRYGDVWMSHLYGDHHNEGHLETEPLTHGMKVIKNKDGVRNSHTAHSEVMISLDGEPRESDGRVIGAALCYGGNFKLRFDTDNGEYHHFFAGINEENSAYHLAKGETFVTPALVLTFSNEGLGGASRNFHRWARKYGMTHGDVPRKVLLNSWEGVYFDIEEDGMNKMMDDIAALGGELFVMDDGWFGVKYPRNNGKTSLGDWIVDTNKLPHGIQGLVDTAKSKGIDFGIWIEPEMTNCYSELYEKHPEYVILPTNRQPNYGRGGTQMVLDLSNPKVQDLVCEVVDTLLTKYPQIDYIKWDANCAIRNHGSQYLDANRQSHLYIEYHKGLTKTLDRIRAKYPDVTIQACAGGGGRANYGILPWFDEFWVSDNTDALQRVYLQWGDSYFFPPTAMASHISASPNHQTQRTVPMKFRIDVAMSGRLGMEMQPSQMTDAEKEMCRGAIEQYKTLVRPVLMDGDIYRLLSPYDRKGAASLMYVSADKDKAVYYWWKTEAMQKQQFPRVAMAGLDPDKMYKVTELNAIDVKPLSYEGKVFSGKYLMDNGLEMPKNYNTAKDDRNEWGSRVLYLEAQ